MSTSTRSNRPAESSEATSSLSNDDMSHPSKKPRFDTRNPSALAADAPEDDAILDADVIGARGPQVRRNAVNIDGFDSDSENEGFDGRAEARAREKEAQKRAEMESDMFADLEEDFASDEDALNKKVKGKDKAPKFLDEEERIEGENFRSKSGGHVKGDFSMNGSGSGKGKGKTQATEDVESSSESEVDDEVRASTGGDVDEEVGAGGKKTHAPKLDAFNMRNEQEDGRFDDQGNYVRKAADPDAKHDTWLEGLSKRDMKRAKEAADRREEELRQREIEDEAVSTGDVLKKLIPYLEPGETTLEALARLGKVKDKKPKWQTKNKNRKKQAEDAADVLMAEEDPSETKRKVAVDAITGAADLLLTRGQPEIYDAERELLIRQYQRETGQEWKEPAASNEDEESPSTKWWEYRWSDARDSGEIHGPYDGATMVQWNDAGYFGEGVEFRQKNTGTGWNRTVDFI